MSQSAKDRVYAAAAQISAEQNPTVSRVREVAGVSNADATRYLKEWREEQASAGSRIAATPQTVIGLANRLAGALWAEATEQAGQAHAALEAQWAAEKKEKDQELAELVADLDRTTAEKETAVTELTARLAAAAADADTAGQRAAAAEESATHASAELNALRVELAAARATADTLQRSLDALLEKITPAAPAEETGD